MAFPIFGEIERLINERGSAKIMKERLALAADQYSALEKKLSNADIRIEQLESENKKLHLNLEKAKTQIRDFEEKFIASHNGGTLEEIKVKILLLMSEHEEAYTHQIASSLGIGTQTAIFHLEELEEKEMVGMSISIGAECPWYLNQEGRKYLVRNNLIK
jgi:septal ring factor EnvC (AmiA/AmiB activator)